MKSCVKITGSKRADANVQVNVKEEILSTEHCKFECKYQQVSVKDLKIKFLVSCDRCYFSHQSNDRT